jgi:hypothetical protein
VSTETTPFSFFPFLAQASPHCVHLC